MMKRIYEAILSRNALVTKGEVPDERITSAQSDLGVLFSEEYIEYISKFGVASFEGHELTGISSIKRLDVVSVTKSNRQTLNNAVAVNELYVIEEANIDGIVIWQDSNGFVYKTFPGYEKPIQINNSFAEYIESV